MRKIRFMTAAAAAAVMIAASGCGAATSASTAAEPAAEAKTVVEAAAEEAAVEEATAEAASDGQNPIMNYVGAYTDENGNGYSMLIEATDDQDGVYVTIGYPHEDSYSYWEMYGTIKDNVITYKEGGKYQLGPTEEDPDEEIVYTDGAGSFEITDDSKLTWKDDKEDAGNGLVFAWDEALNKQIQDMMAEAGMTADGAFEGSVLNWAGPYSDLNDLNRTMEISPVEGSDTDCVIEIQETTSPTLTTTWTMKGVYYEETLSIDYKECVKKEITLDNKGNQVSEKVIYEDGEGRFTIDEEQQTIEWSDEVEDAGRGSRFGFRFSYENAAAEEAGTSGDASAE